MPVAVIWPLDLGEPAEWVRPDGVEALVVVEGQNQGRRRMVAQAVEGAAPPVGRAVPAVILEDLA